MTPILGQISMSVNNTMTKIEFIEKMIALGVRYQTPGIFPNGAWKQQGSILSAYAGNVLVGQYDCATGQGWSVEV